MPPRINSLPLLLLVLAACQPVSTVPSITAIPTAATIVIQTEPVTQVDSYLASLVAQDEFSGSVLVALEGQVILAKGYGLADRQGNLPNTPATKFRIGSITKQFTAVAILLLQDRGSLVTADPICDYLMECPEAWLGITLHHLLTHTSGIPDFIDLAGYEEKKDQPTTNMELITRFLHEPLVFHSGTDWQYSNSNYILLGHVIEQASGQPYSDFIQQNIFDPVQMTSSGYDYQQDTLAVGYTGIGSEWSLADSIDPSVPGGAGALYSTVGDLLLWEQALFSGRLIAPETLELMLAPYASTPLGDQGYGIFTSYKHGRTVIRHGGGGDGYLSNLEYYPELPAVFILLTNRDTFDLGSITETVVGTILGE